MVFSTVDYYQENIYFKSCNIVPISYFCVPISYFCVPISYL